MNRTTHEAKNLKHITNRGDIISTSDNSLRGIKNSKSGVIASKTLQFDNQGDETMRLQNIENKLKLQIGKLETNFDDQRSSNDEQNEINKNKMLVISESLVDFTSEFPKFSLFLNQIKMLYDSAIQEFVLKQKTK